VNDSDLQPEPTPSSQPTPSTPRWITVVGIIAVLLLAAFAAMSRIRVDSKVISSPGSVLEIESVVEVTDGPFFPSEGEIYLTTVSTNLDPTVIEYIAAWFDDSAVILDRELVLGDRSIEQNRTLGQEQMTQSQDIATRVALEWLGYEVITEAGALIQQVSSDAPAAEAVSSGDVVIEASGKEVLTSVDLVDAVQRLSPGDTLDFTVLEVGGTTREESVVLADRDGAAFLGVSISTFVEIEELPFGIEVDARRIGGPSAGLALALTILDLLTEGELTAGTQIATTGTIDPLGNVGAIGGIEQKTYAVIRAGVTLFIVPQDNLEGALAVSEGQADWLTVVGVSTLDEALAAIEAHTGEPIEFPPLD
jgi:PDZ domain-containing protein